MADLKSLGWLVDIVLGIWQRIPAPVFHNLGKARAIKMAFWHANLEGTPGCYVEFGVATGNSMRAAAIAEQTAHSASLGVPRTCRKLHGFDTFEAFSSSSTGDAHPVWQGDKFNIPRGRVDRRFRSDLGRRIHFHTQDATALPDPRRDTGGNGAAETLNDTACAIVLLDMDLAQPTYAALVWLEPVLVEGTMLFLDEYCGFGGSPVTGEAGALSTFLAEHPWWDVSLLTMYGDGGRVYVLYRTSTERPG